MKNKKERYIGLSLITVLMLGTSAYAGKIIGANASDPYVATTPATQSGFGGWDLTNVTVKITDLNYNEIAKLFDTSNGTYDTMTVGDSFESQISTNDVHRGNLHGKDWPVGEPAGIKIINNDNQSNGKPDNCIMTTSYLSESDNSTGLNGYLDSATPAPTICSSPFQTHKRFKINMLPTTVESIDEEGYGLPIDLVFNLDAGDTNTANVRYQVLQKINNYTGLRLDGYKLEVLKGSGIAAVADSTLLTISLGLGENDGGDIWAADAMATFSHGLWGEADLPHFPTDGFFDTVASGYIVTGHGTTTITGGQTTLGSNYTALFGNWLPSKWQPTGIFWDSDNDSTTDADLVAFFGTTPTDPAGTAPSWHKGIADNWETPTDTEFLQWDTDPLYMESEIEDTLNLGLNYIVNIGSNNAIGSTFTIRITPHVSVNQDPPSYVDGSGNPIPPVRPTITDGTVAISPAPTFIIGDTLLLSVKDEDQNTNPAVKDTTTVTVTTDTGDKETVTLTETEVSSAVFTATIPSELTTSSPAVGDGKINVIKDAEVTVTYVDNTHNTSASTTATIPTVATDEAVDSSGDTASSGGGGCTANPNAKSFDMMFLFMMALGLLYPFRRRFIK